MLDSKFKKTLLVIIFILTILQGCASVSSFPSMARSGNTVSLMIGGSEKARKETIDVVLTDVNGVAWDLQALGKVRSVFNLRMDAKAEAQNYSSFLDAYFPWFYGHEPVQTVLVIDLPVGLPVGNSKISVNTNIDDDSSGILQPFDIKLEIISGNGESDDFVRQDSDGDIAADFSKLEPVPYAKIDFSGNSSVIIGAASFIVDFDQTVVSSGDLNVYVPQSTVRGSVLDTGEFGDKQRMVYWHQDGDQLYIDIVSPQGLLSPYLLLYIMHPRGIASSPNFQLISSAVYNVYGEKIILSPNMQYYP